MLVLLIDKMNIGTKDPDRGCLDDWLEIREGKGPKAPYLARFCGTRRSIAITVFVDGVYIRLHSTNSTKKTNKPNPTAAAHQPLQDWWLRQVLLKKTVKQSFGFSLRYKISGKVNMCG